MYTPEMVKKQSEMTINAFVQRIRKASGISFVTLRYGEYLFQGVYIPELCKTPISQMCEGAYVQADVSVKPEKRSQYGFELTIKDFTVLAKPQEELPFSISQPTLSTTLEETVSYPELAIRHPQKREVMALRSKLSHRYSEYMYNNGFIAVNTPKITSQQADRDYINVRYFDHNASLTHSPTLYHIMAVGGLDKVYEIGNGYSSKNGNSIRHLNEFTRMDFELTYTDSRSLRKLIGEILCYITDAKLPAIPEISHSDAMNFLGKPQTQPDLDPTDEKKLCEWAKSEYDSEYVFVTELPTGKRPFYEQNPFVLLSKGLEIASGSEHTGDYGMISERLTDYDAQISKYSPYIASYKYGMPMSGGVAIGLERLVMSLMDLSNIREATFITRDLKHLVP